MEKEQCFYHGWEARRHGGYHESDKVTQKALWHITEGMIKSSSHSGTLAYPFSTSRGFEVKGLGGLFWFVLFVCLVVVVFFVFVFLCGGYEYTKGTTATITFKPSLVPKKNN